MPEEDLNHQEFVPDEFGNLPTPRLLYEIRETEFGKCVAVRPVSGSLNIGVLQPYPDGNGRS